VRVHLKRDPRVRVTQEFLSGFQVRSRRSQVGCQRMPEAVPSDHLAGNLRPDKSGTDDPCRIMSSVTGVFPSFRAEGKRKSSSPWYGDFFLQAYRHSMTDVCNGTGFRLSAYLRLSLIPV
jgi:hypothetical protein